MADSYDRYDQEHHGAGFMIGLLAGTVLGAGLGMLLTPKNGPEMRGTIGEQAKHLGHKASEQYRKASDTAGTWAGKGREYVDRARQTVAKRADEAREYINTQTSSRSGGPDEHRYGGVGTDATRS